jgi:hypothetical protein
MIRIFPGIPKIIIIVKYAKLRTQLRKSHALKCLGCIACISVLLSWPEGIFSGLKLDYLGNNQTSHDCS